MFRCENCGELSEPGEVSVRQPVEFRPKSYPPRHAVNRGGFSDPGGEGLEIAREITVCVECAK